MKMKKAVAIFALIAVLPIIGWVHPLFWRWISSPHWSYSESGWLIIGVFIIATLVLAWILVVYKVIGNFLRTD